MINKFQEWAKETGVPTDSYFVARRAWDAAIKKAVAIVEENYDEMEPWLEPSDIAQLDSGAQD